MMSKKLKLFLVTGMCFAISLFSLAQMNSPWAKKLDNPDAYTIQHTAEFSKADLSFDKLMGYDIVRLNDGDYLWAVGKPMLPYKELKVALPTGMAAKRVRVVDTKSEEIPGEYNIFPAQPPRSTEFSDRNVDFVEPDNETYTSTQPYPSTLVEFVRQSDLAGQGIAVIQIYPLQYVPSEKRLTLYSSITLVIEGVGGYQCGDYLPPNISEKGRKTYEKMVKDMVVNPEDVQLNTTFEIGKSTVLPAGSFDHVIITSVSFSSYFQPLVDWHTRKGVKDTVVTTTWIYGNYAGADTQKIRSFISDAHSTWNTTYFLLGGEKETVPFVYRTYYLESTPSDQYYSDCDTDWVHEVFVGRVSVGSSTEVTTFVNKVLKYEKNPPRTNYPLDVLLIGMDMESQTHCQFLKDTLDNHIPSRFNVTKVYDSDAGNHRDSVLHYLNAGQNLVNHADHCASNGICAGYLNHGSSWCISNTDVDALTNNNQMSVVVAPLGCKASMIDSEDCVAEHFVIYNPYRAGVAFIGNTREGYHGLGACDLYSGKLDREWWMGLFDRNLYNLGQTLVDSKNNFSSSDPCSRHCEWTLNLLGEPEMPIWTDAPDSFAVTYPSTLPPESSSFLVHVEGSTKLAPVESAYVCLWKGNEVYLTGYTNTSGDLTFTPSPDTTGIMYVTVTKHNYIPYEGGANVIFTLPVVTTDSATDVEETTSTLHGYLEHDGGLETTCWFMWDTNSGEPYAHSVSVGVVTGGSEFTKGLTGLAEGELYYFNTKAQNSLGDSSDGELTFLTKPLPPTDLTAQGTNCGTIYLSWNKPASADKIIIERNNAPTWARGEGEEIYNGTGTNHEDSGLPPSTHYYYQAWSYCTEEGLEQYSDDHDSADATTLDYFAPAVNYPAGNGPQSVFCADLDGDGDLDLAVANYSSDNVSIFKNNGNGTFYLDSNYAVGDGPYSVFCADLDTFPGLDLAVAYCRCGVSILMNNGDGTFQPKVDYPAGDYPTSVFCADLDGDGDVDLAVADYNLGNVSILMNNGVGTFQPKVDYQASATLYSVFCADLDTFPGLDLATASRNSNCIVILTNNGDGTFARDSAYDVLAYPLSVFCGDLDGDTDLDLAVGYDMGNNVVSILKNNGDGTFQPKVDYGIGSRAASVFCADLDGDGDLDLAVSNYYDNNVSILKNNGDGIFQPKVDYNVGNGPMGVFCADLDGEGDFDLAVANSGSDSVSILKNSCQIPANQAPWAFHLVSPLDEHTTSSVVDFDWQTAYDPNLGDQIRYDLYVSTTLKFEPLNTIIDSNLLVSKHTHTDSLDTGIYYWKVKAKDNWGAFRWSQETWRFFNSYYLTDTLTIVAFSPETLSPVDLVVTDPNGDSIGIGFNTIPGATYDDDTSYYNQHGHSDDIVTLPNRLVGDYLIRVVTEPGQDGVYSLGIRIDGTNMVMLAIDKPCPPPGEAQTFSYNVPWYIGGDVNGDWKTDAADVVYLINYLYIEGPTPEPFEAGDVDYDGIINASDVVYLINYLFINGPPPPCQFSNKM
jgi:hypothetical protein